MLSSRIVHRNSVKRIEVLGTDHIAFRVNQMVNNATALDATRDNSVLSVRFQRVRIDKNVMPFDSAFFKLVVNPRQFG